jgi:hypothetical protein
MMMSATVPPRGLRHIVHRRLDTADIAGLASAFEDTAVDDDV